MIPGTLAIRSAAAPGLVLLAGLLALTGCYNPGPRFNPHLPSPTRAMDMAAVPLTNQVDPAWLKPPADFFTLGPGDKIELELLGDPATKTLAVVGPDGKIYFNLIAGLDVWGLTLAETKAKIEKGLAEFIRDKVTVTVTLRDVESKRIWLLGRVQSPGVYNMTSPMTVLEAIAMAGGTYSLAGTRDSGGGVTGEELADLRRSFVIRRGQMLPVDFDRLLRQGDISQNIYLQSDDFIYFPSAVTRTVYVLGAVASPRAVPYSENMSVLTAIANASGTIPDAYLRHVAVLRGSLSEPRVAIVDYKEIATGQAPDIPLEPQDIVYVPFSPYRYLKRYVELIANTFVSTVAINEGARAVLKEPTSTSVFIPVGGPAVTPVSPAVPTVR